MTRAELTEQILVHRRRKGLSFTEIAEQLGQDRVWLTAALLGQHPIPEATGRALAELLGLNGEDVVPLLAEVPMRGSGEQVIPTDPTVYRLYEVLQVYGPALKALLHEDFGDGIMSAINFQLDIGREERDGEARVRITLDGKFLPYAW